MEPWEKESGAGLCQHHAKCDPWSLGAPLSSPHYSESLQWFARGPFFLLWYSHSLSQQEVSIWLHNTLGTSDPFHSSSHFFSAIFIPCCIAFSREMPNPVYSPASPFSALRLSSPSPKYLVPTVSIKLSSHPPSPPPLGIISPEVCHSAV